MRNFGKVKDVGDMRKFVERYDTLDVSTFLEYGNGVENGQ